MATANEILAVASKEIGVKESPSGSNNVKYNTAYYGQEVWDGKAGGKYPWCVVFLWWVFHQAEAGGLFYGGKKTASCSALMSYAQEHGQWVTSGYRAGDIVIMDIHGNKVKTDHCGLVVTPLTTGVRTIEGNTGVGNDSNGGTVMERSRPASYIVGACRPRYEEVNEVRYNTLEELSSKKIYYKVMSDLYQSNIFRGKASGLDVSEDMVRVFVVNYRAGLYDTALLASGIVRDRTV